MGRSGDRLSDASMVHRRNARSKRAVARHESAKDIPNDVVRVARCQRGPLLSDAKLRRPLHRNGYGCGFAGFAIFAGMVGAMPARCRWAHAISIRAYGPLRELLVCILASGGGIWTYGL